MRQHQRQGCCLGENWHSAAISLKGGGGGGFVTITSLLVYNKQTLALNLNLFHGLKFTMKFFPMQLAQLTLFGHCLCLPTQRTKKLQLHFHDFQ